MNGLVSIELSLRKESTNRFMSEMSKKFMNGDTKSAYKMAKIFRKGAKEGKVSMSSGKEIKPSGKEARRYAISRTKENKEIVRKIGNNTADTPAERMAQRGKKTKPTYKMIDNNGAFNHAKAHFGPIKEDIAEKGSLGKLIHRPMVRKVPQTGNGNINIEKGYGKLVKTMEKDKPKGFSKIRGHINSKENKNIKKAVYQDIGKEKGAGEEYRKVTREFSGKGNLPSLALKKGQKGLVKNENRMNKNVKKLNKKLKSSGLEVGDLHDGNITATKREIFDPILVESKKIVSKHENGSPMVPPSGYERGVKAPSWVKKKNDYTGTEIASKRETHRLEQKLASKKFRVKHSADPKKRKEIERRVRANRPPPKRPSISITF